MTDKKQFVVLSKKMSEPEKYRRERYDRYCLKVLDKMGELIVESSVSSLGWSVSDREMRGMGDLMASIYDSDKSYVVSLRDVAKDLVYGISGKVEYDPEMDSVFSCSQHAEKCQDYYSDATYYKSTQQLVDLVRKELENSHIRRQIRELERKLE